MKFIVRLMIVEAVTQTEVEAETKEDAIKLLVQEASAGKVEFKVPPPYMRVFSDAWPVEDTKIVTDQKQIEEKKEEKDAASQNT